MRLSVSPALVIAALSVVALTGCSASPVPASPGTASTAEANAPAGSAATASSEPSTGETPDTAASVSAAITCADIEPLAASITGSFTLSAADSVEGVEGTTCVWTNEAITSGSTDIADYAALSVGIDDLAWTAEELSTLPGATDDPRAGALGGRVLILGSGGTLGEVGSVQVLSPRGSVTIVATGTLLTAAPDTAIPVDAVIDVAAAVAAMRA